MDNVSRPLIAVLVATVAFFALWLVALKPSSSSTTGRPQGLGAYQSAINKAHQAVTTANAAATAEGGTVATTATGTAAQAETAARTPVSHPKVHPAPAASTAVSRALAHGKVLALLFYNPAATDDRAVKHELASVPAHKGRVFKLAVPIGQLSRYAIVTNQVPVVASPTLVVVDSSRQASTIMGFADRFEIAQRVADALP